MKVLFDTSVMVAALVPAHEHHARCFPWLARSGRDGFRSHVAAHSLTELFSVLTELPLRPRISPAAAMRLIDENVLQRSRVVALDAAEFADLLRDVARLGLSGGVIHDAVIARAARKARVDTLLTLNVADFRRAWPEGHAVISAP